MFFIIKNWLSVYIFTFKVYIRESEKLGVLNEQQEEKITFREFQDDTGFCDVTLASEGNQQIKTHKVISGVHIILRNQESSGMKILHI